MAVSKRTTKQVESEYREEPVSEVEWHDTWRNGPVKVTLFSFVEDDKLSVKAMDGDDLLGYLSWSEVAERIEQPLEVVRNWMQNASRYAGTVQAALDAYYTEKGFRSSAQDRADREERFGKAGI